MEILQTKMSVSLDTKDMDVIANALLEGMIKFAIHKIIQSDDVDLSNDIYECKKHDISLLNDLSKTLGKLSFATEEKVVKYVVDQSRDFIRIVKSIQSETMVIVPELDTDFAIKLSNVINHAKIENCTPHEVRIFDSIKNGGQQIYYSKPSQCAARVHFSNRVDGHINDVPVNHIDSLEIKNLPPKKENTLYIVSFFVLYILAGKRDDVISPDSAQLVKDKGSGFVLGSRGFIKMK